MRPRDTASASTSSIRSRVSITRLRGWIRFLRSTSRSSAALFADTSLAGRAAAPAARFDWLLARCWRPRALPPLRAAALRALAERPPDAGLRAEDDLLAEDDVF